jgi:malate dehydrogenase (oxaloacetate-decarboxylating)
VIPSPFDDRVAPAVVAAVADQARKEGVART